MFISNIIPGVETQNGIKTKIKQTHFLALSPNSTFKTDHFLANSFPVPVTRAHRPRSWPRQPPRTRWSDDDGDDDDEDEDDNGPPKLPCGEQEVAAEVPLSLLLRQRVSSSQQGTFPQRKAEAGSTSSSGRRDLREERRGQGLRPVSPGV